jgi:adenosylmethionine-8-amino-7-oxononanoate aminotransferase
MIAKKSASSMSSDIFHRSLTKTCPTAVAGHCVYIQDRDGNLIIDGSSGAAVSCLGHGHKEVIKAIVEQARQLAFAHTSFFTNDLAEELASFLISAGPNVFSKVMFLSSGMSLRLRLPRWKMWLITPPGSEAVESALKLARQYHLCNGQTDRYIFTSRKFSYHGDTLGALSAGFNPARRGPFEPMLSQAFRHVSPCFFTHDGLPGESEEAYVDRLIDEYENVFSDVGADRVAAIIIEPMSGATLGAAPAVKGCLGRPRNLCDRHGCLLIFDEVMCGMGRAGALHAWQSLGGTAPDIQTIGKGLGTGHQPISAILVANKVHDALNRAQGQYPFVSGHTYQGHSIGCAAALVTQRVIVKDNLLDNVQRMGEKVSQWPRTRTPLLKEVRGLGLFELPSSRLSRATALQQRWLQRA